MEPDHFSDNPPNQRRKKRLKHYPVLINGITVSIVNHHFKQKQRAGKTVFYLELVSSQSFPTPPSGTTVIEFEENGEPITVEAAYDHGFSGDGRHVMVFRVPPRN